MTAASNPRIRFARSVSREEIKNMLKAYAEKHERFWPDTFAVDNGLGVCDVLDACDELIEDGIFEQKSKASVRRANRVGKKTPDREMNDQERARLEAMVKDGLIRPGESCPMDGCKGHLEATYPDLTDHSGRRESITIEVLRCDRLECKFRGIIPERMAARIEAWQKEASE